jgi:hypothetical protein
MMARPMQIDTSGWGPFDPASATDAMCERERLAFTEYTLKRLKKMPRTGSDESAIWIGAVMSLVQVAYAMHSDTPSEAARQAIHDSVDFAWLQCAGMVAGRGEMN